MLYSHQKHGSLRVVNIATCKINTRKRLDIRKLANSSKPISYVQGPETEHGNIIHLVQSHFAGDQSIDSPGQSQISDKPNLVNRNVWFTNKTTSSGRRRKNCRRMSFYCTKDIEVTKKVRESAIWEPINILYDTDLYAWSAWGPNSDNIVTDEMIPETARQLPLIMCT